MATWCSLLFLKADMGVDLEDTRDDEALRDVLDAACVFVQRMRPEFAFDDEESQLPPVPDDVRLGTARLAGRWHVRRRSPDALVQTVEFGASRVPAFDSDIERLLGIGRYRASVIA